ncbi:Uma2 family endonuclease [Pseudanabaena sp. UWO310]|uniref:Uma2 family endonuclease n=1 Tax=Pseudanabaena sp. UWO310 TaxID=2480795 RepID=UPI00115C3CE1|nr:Uma2 family endonuclease [Pseudanabaena sp. UWO310]TYQ28797.1 Uma2 family endonuclease [Pseudanabaena sp. UWO310]
MSITLSKSTHIELEQKLLLPRIYSWQEFEVLENLLATCGFRITYLDGWIELMTVGEPHELIKKSLAILLEAYFIIQGIEFIPMGSATRRGQEKGTSFEPDESYCFGEKKANPDLAIEVILTSGSLEKLEKYRRFEIPEVWLWENNQLQVYAFISSEYHLVPRSQLLPDLDIDLLVSCVQMPSRLEAMRAFRHGLHHE